MAEAIRLKNVESAFMEVPREGAWRKFDGLPFVITLDHHVQGFTKAFVDQTETEYTEYNVFSHSNSGNFPNNGFIIVQKDGESAKKFNLPNDETHPGGIQAVGPYVFIICEVKSKSNSHSTLYVFDVRAAEDENIVGFCYKQHFENHPGSCLGITTTKIDGKEKYLLVVNGNDEPERTCYFYTSDITDEKDEKGQLKLNFVFIGSDSLKNLYSSKYDYEGMALLTDENEAVYSVSFTCNGEGLYNVDRMILTKIELPDGRPRFVEIIDGNRTMRAIHEVVPNIFGVHFRWGSSAYITKYGKLVIIATARNILLTPEKTTILEFNYWE